MRIEIPPDQALMLERYWFEYIGTVALISELTRRGADFDEKMGQIILERSTEASIGYKLAWSEILKSNVEESQRHYDWECDFDKSEIYVRCKRGSVLCE